MSRFVLGRRALLVGVGALAIAPADGFGQVLRITVTKDPSCGCCGGWVQHLRAAGFVATVVDGDVAPAKRRLGVPADLASCHTA
jgi:hypothetical protein